MAIYKRKDRQDSRWWIRYRTADGRWRKEPVGESYKLAKAVESKRKAETAEGRHYPGRRANSRPFGEVLDRFWQDHGRFLRSRTWEDYTAELRAEFGARSIGSITTANCQQFYNAVRDRSSVGSANRKFTLLRSVFNRAKTWGLFFGENPCTAVKREREANHRLRYLSSVEMERLLAHAHPRLYPVLMCALLTGMRRGEILALDWRDVNLERGVLYILQSKSGKPREVPIAGKLRAVLLDLGPLPSGPVFDLPVIMLRRFFDRAVKAAGLTDFRFHDLRHSFASWFIMRTSDLTALQRVLGHSTPALTLRYAHLSRGHMASNMAAFEAAIPDSGPENGPALSPGLSPSRNAGLPESRIIA